MSEVDRSRLYAWLCAEHDESLAEYVMSCLAPAPLSDLVTKDFMTAEFALLRREIAAQRQADREEARELREADRKEFAQFRAGLAAQREADRQEARELREADRAEARRTIRWLKYVLPLEFVVGFAGVVAVLEWLRAGG